MWLVLLGFGQGRPDIMWMQGGTNLVLSVAFSPDGSLLASGSSDGTVWLWRVSDGALVRTLQHATAVRSIAFSPNGQLLASVASERVIYLWRVSDGTRRDIVLQSDMPNPSDVTFSPDGNFVVIGLSYSPIAPA